MFDYGNTTVTPNSVEKQQLGLQLSVLSFGLPISISTYPVTERLVLRNYNIVVFDGDRR